MESLSLVIKPHHLLDIFKLYGRGVEYSKNQYNEELDRRLIDRLGLETDKGYKFSDVILWVYGKLSLDLVEYVWRDREREENESRYEDTRRGMEKYLTGERAGAVTRDLAN